MKSLTAVLLLLTVVFAAVPRSGAVTGQQEQAIEESITEWLREQEKLIKKGKLDEVLAILEEAVVATNMPEIWRLLGKVYYQKQKIEEAIYCYTVVKALKPDDAGVAAWLQGALQGRTPPAIRTAPALVLSVHGMMSSKENELWFRGPADKEMRKASRTVRFRLEAGTGMLWFFVGFGVQEGEAYWISLGTAYASTGDLKFGEEKPFPASEKVLPPGFDPAKTSSN